MDSTPRIFERKFATYMLLLICREPGHTKTYYVEYDPKFVRTKHMRIDELERAGLIWIDKGSRKGNTRLLYPTVEGKAIGDAILAAYPKIKGQDVDPDDY